MKVGVLMSGGLDSSILAAIISQKAQGNVIGYGFEQLTNNIIFTQKICNVINIPFETIDVALDSPNEVEEAADLVSPIVDVLYIGINKTIPVDKETYYPNRLEEEYIKELEKTTNIRFPFRNLTKPQILQLGLDRVKQIDDIIKYSHTCCVTTGMRCNECYNCLERKIAFETLGLEDHGKY